MGWEVWALIGAVVVAVIIPFAVDLVRGRISRRPTMEVEPKRRRGPRYLIWWD